MKKESRKFKKLWIQSLFYYLIFIILAFFVLKRNYASGETLSLTVIFIVLSFILGLFGFVICFETLTQKIHITKFFYINKKRMNTNRSFALYAFGLGFISSPAIFAMVYYSIFHNLIFYTILTLCSLILSILVVPKQNYSLFYTTKKGK